jgi:endonuclease/exonuclease/phosphatase family metal-dependent hydrolase
VILAIVGWCVWLPTSAGPAEGSSFDGPTPKSSAANNSLRLATFNIDSGRGTDDVVDLKRTAASLQHIDFIGLNEVRGGDIIGGQPIQTMQIAEFLGLQYLFAPAERRFSGDGFGNAVLTNLPVERWQRVVLPSRRFKALRNYVLTDAGWSGRTVHFLTTHTDWKPGGYEQREQVIKTFLALPEPAVLMGDLNAPQHDPQIERLLTTPNVEEAIDTVLGPEPGRVDWIFVRGFKTLDAGRVDIGASDHPAYWAQVQLK